MLVCQNLKYHTNHMKVGLRQNWNSEESATFTVTLAMVGVLVVLYCTTTTMSFTDCRKNTLTEVIIFMLYCTYMHSLLLLPLLCCDVGVTYTACSMVLLCRRKNKTMMSQPQSVDIIKNPLSHCHRQNYSDFCTNLRRAFRGVRSPCSWLFQGAEHHCLPPIHGSSWQKIF
jgi:hypothetical protein